MPRTTVADLTQRIRRQLDSSQRQEVNILGASLDTTETTATLGYDVTPSVRPGALLSIGRELVRVVSVNAGAHEAVIHRAWADSVREAHFIGDEVLVSPRFTLFDIHDAIIDEGLSWSNDLYRVLGVTVDSTDAQQVLELPASMTNAIGIVRMYAHSVDSILPSTPTSWPEQPFRLQRGTPGEWTGVAGSGLLVRFTTHVNIGKVFVLVALPFDFESIDEDTDLVADLGMEHSMLEVLSLGVKWRLLGDSEHGRSARTAQDEPRRAEETPPRSASDDSNLTFSRYQQRLGLEVQRLQRRYPVRTW